MSFSKRSFIRHFLEMVVAMVVGMVLLDQVAWLLLASFAQLNLFDNPGLYAPVMSLNMIIGMSVWMIYRRHNLRSISEMAGAMILPLCVFIAPYWEGLLSGDVLIVGSMALMLPAMVVTMLYRRTMYGMMHSHMTMAPGSMGPTHAGHFHGVEAWPATEPSDQERKR